MSQVIVTPQAQRDIEKAIAELSLPDDTWARVERSLRIIETFPLGGRALKGRWGGARFVLGPWQWMVLLYRYDEGRDKVYVVAMHDGRSACSASAGED